jgi:hypothetical protein
MPKPHPAEYKYGNAQNAKTRESIHPAPPRKKMPTISIAFRRIGAQEELDNERKKFVRMSEVEGGGLVVEKPRELSVMLRKRHAEPWDRGNIPHK